MQVDGYDIDILVQGYPGKTVCRGGLGWSIIVLIRGRGRVGLVDTGGVVVPGHDIPMSLKDGRPEYLAKREAVIKAWFCDDMDTMTAVELAVK